MASKYKVGDLVKLRSGGPTMTVKTVPNALDFDEGRPYRCQWFAGKKAETEVFPEASLEPDAGPSVG